MQFKKRNIAIIGSTGSIGRQALEVIAHQSDLLSAEVLVAGSNAELLVEQARQFLPNAVVIINKEKYSIVKEALHNEPVKVFCGEESVMDILEWESVNMVLSAFVGFAGLRSTLKALEFGKPVALANKESLVVAGALLTETASRSKVPILPVDSEHSAVFQCLAGENEKEIEQIILTASGGPFRGKTKDELEHVTSYDALKHPNWSMGAKITIDSSTLMNKGLEVIEARWLFNCAPEKIKVVVHPQSIIHSMIMFTDGSIKAQLGLPDMRLPIQYALCYPHRPKNDFPRYDFKVPSSLTFEEPDLHTFPCLELAYDALRKGGNIPCVLNAANEIAVELFLNGKIKFTQIPELIRKAMENTEFISRPNLEQLTESDRETRKFVMLQANS
ncbi:MAG: 1-deoxy-D-xylulose-5-phosphate reductoisomerase [Bacteroidia bacterium]|nr:1-deoxy-D-xylulose-5-phosphate reductoisomerase [Bacteroidia bacterium]